MTPTPLTDAFLTAALAGLPGWSGDGAGLRRTFRFASFGEAVAWMHRLVPAIDALGHHPEWRNVYDRVEVVLRTHDAGDRVTDLDLRLARLLSEAAPTR